MGMISFSPHIPVRWRQTSRDVRGPSPNPTVPELGPLQVQTHVPLKLRDGKYYRGVEEVVILSADVENKAGRLHALDKDQGSAWVSEADTGKFRWIGTDYLTYGG